MFSTIGRVERTESLMRFAGLKHALSRLLGEPASAVVAAADRRGVAVARDATNNVFITGQVTGDIQVSAPDDTRRTLSPCTSSPPTFRISPAAAPRWTNFCACWRPQAGGSRSARSTAWAGSARRRSRCMSGIGSPSAIRTARSWSTWGHHGGAAGAGASVARVIGAFAPQMRLPEAVAELRPTICRAARQTRAGGAGQRG